MKTLLTAALLAAALPARAGFGFVWANDHDVAPLTPYTPAATFQYNSSGRTNTVIHYYPGYYEVRMPGVMGPARDGNVQVTAYGNDAAYCKVKRWDRRSSSDASILVTCFDEHGAPADSRFTVLYHDEQIDPVARAYVMLDRADRETWPSECCYAPPDRWTFNPRSPGDPAGDLWISSLGGVGRYLVFIHGWHELEANMLVTASGGSNARCNLTRVGHDSAWATVGGFRIERHVASVSCHRPGDAAINSSFTLAYANGRTLGHGGAYLLTGVTTSMMEIEPPANRSANSAGGRNFVRSTGIGRYTARLGGLAGSFSKSTALVTAVNGGGEHCKVRGWSSDTSDVLVNVACFGLDGLPAHSGFSLHFATD
jgi:hypothetical protein